MPCLVPHRGRETYHGAIITWKRFPYSGLFCEQNHRSTAKGKSVGVWNALKLEKINRKALRIVVNDYTLSYTDLLHTTKRCPLYVSRLKSMATEMFKSMTHNSPTFIENLFTMSDTPYDLRGGKSIIQPSVETTTFGLKSFRYEGAKLWNNLPSEMKCASSLKDFKVLVKQWTGPSCHCRSCVLCDIDQLWAALGYTC